MRELSTKANLDGINCLILKGSYKEGAIEKTLRKYAEEYVVCQACKSADTVLSRDPNTRLNVLTCNKCGAVRNVQSVYAGFTAQTARRAAQRAKQT